VSQSAWFAFSVALEKPSWPLTGMTEVTMENTEIVGNQKEAGARANAPFQEEPAPPVITQMRWTDSVWIRFHAIWLRRTDLWEEVRRFSSWFEFEAVPLAVERNENEIILDIEAKGMVQSLRIGGKPYNKGWDGYAQLWDFLWSLGIRTIHLDARLERNQIEDVISLLYCYRKSVRAARSTSDRVLGQLMSPQGVHASCTQTSLCDGTLRIIYTYCTLQFSRIVHWFEARNARFHDHRTLFHAAPRYAVAFALIVTGPAMVLSAIFGHLVLSAIIGASAAVLFVLTYTSFMIVGSVEYDNEEKAYRLSKAYGRLKEYTNRIRADIERARIVQETFLPALDRMPFQDHIQWAAGFMPAEEVGGDYFDVAALDSARVAILFSDVSGHGMAAAFVTAIMKTTFQAWLDAEDTLEGLARQMNVNLLRLVPIGSFAAAFIAIYDRSTHRLHYTNCGHQPEPWRIPGRKDHTIHSLSDARNLIMGVEERADIAVSSVTLEPGDMVLFVSDGIVENPNVDGKLYGTDQFESFLQSRRSLIPQALVQTISDEARDYSRGTDQSDDRTILALRIKE
jgi:sigma-B regulation protein RsbU (phosphoserine phosphatase)